MIRSVVVRNSGIYVYYLSASGRCTQRIYKVAAPDTVAKWMLRSDVECTVTRTAYMYQLKQTVKEKNE